MTYDDSETRKLYDQITGQAFGVPYNTASSQGAKFYKEPGIGVGSDQSAGNYHSGREPKRKRQSVGVCQEKKKEG